MFFQNKWASYKKEMKELLGKLALSIDDHMKSYKQGLDDSIFLYSVMKHIKTGNPELP